MFDTRSTTPMERVLDADRRQQALEKEVMELTAHMAAAAGRLSELLNDFEADAVMSPGTNVDSTDWLAWIGGMTHRQARRHLKLARHLKDLPEIAGALRIGALTFDKAEIIARIATLETETLLLHWAEHATAAQLNVIAQAHQRATRPAREDFARRACRRVSSFFDDDGYYHLNALLPGDQGAIVDTALDAALKVLKDDAADPDNPPDEAQNRLAAERFEALSADALVTVAESFLASGPARRSDPERFQVIVTAELESLRDGDVPAEMFAGIPIPAETARRLTCDCSIVPMITIDGQPLNVGRKTRRLNRALRRALRVRDQGRCTVPGCTRKGTLEAHHVIHWTKHGPTELENLITLCSDHHVLMHEGGYWAEITIEGDILFFRPDGTQVPAAPPSLCEFMRAENRAQIEFTWGAPPGPHWIDPVDMDAAIAGLLALERERAPASLP